MRADNGLIYRISDDGKYAIVIGYVGTQADVVIPATFNGVTVKKIGDSAFYNNYVIKSISIPSTVVSIGSLAFFSCDGLTSFTIPKTVTEIGVGAFRYCSRLSTVTFENKTGWWYASSADATSGTAIDSRELTNNGSNPTRAANTIKIEYTYYYWKYREGSI